MSHRRIRRRLAAVVMGAAVTMIAALPVGATPKDAGGGHKITICHVTNSAANPYVVVDVDVAAFDGEGTNDHTHHMSKDGRVDVPFVNGVCGGDTTSPPDVEL